MTLDQFILVRDGDGTIQGAVLPGDALNPQIDMEILANDIPDKSWTYTLVNVTNLTDFLESLSGAFQGIS